MDFNEFEKKYGANLAILVFADNLPEGVSFDDIILAYCDAKTGKSGKEMLATSLEKRDLTIPQCGRFMYVAANDARKSRLAERIDRLIESIDLDECVKTHSELKKTISIDDKVQKDILERLLEKIRLLARPRSSAV